jgi:hypothetical protein
MTAECACLSEKYIYLEVIAMLRSELEKIADKRK